MDTKTLPEANLDLPIVRLADVEENLALVRGEPSYVSDNVDWGNRYSYSCNCLFLRKSTTPPLHPII